jgi:hypothetical protein
MVLPGRRRPRTGIYALGGPYRATAFQHVKRSARPGAGVPGGATAAVGGHAGVFAPPADVDDFTLRFAAILDGLAILRLRQMHQPSRKRLVELALTTGRAELTAR